LLDGVTASNCKRTGRARRTKVTCRLSRASSISRFSVRLTRRGRLGRRGTMTINVRRPLRRGRYVLVIRLTGTDGSRRTLRVTKRL
jgi:hypothetical protein